MAPAGSRLRAAGLIVTGAVAVHELRYVATGSAADPVAGHGYLPIAGFLSVSVLALACAQLAATVERARRTGSARESAAPGFAAAWLVSVLALAGIFLVQELLEGLLAHGRPPGLAAVVADGGWIAFPIAVGVGALLALAFAGVRSAVAAAERHGRRSAPRRRSRRRRPLPGAHPLSGRPLALNLAGRAPPRSLS